MLADVYRHQPAAGLNVQATLIRTDSLVQTQHSNTSNNAGVMVVIEQAAASSTMRF